MFTITYGALISLLEAITGVELYLTGGRVFGAAAPAYPGDLLATSVDGIDDIDLIAPSGKGVAYKIMAALGATLVLGGSATGSTRLRMFEALTLDIIVLDPIQVQAWQYATEECKKLRYKAGTTMQTMIRKETRVAVFAALCRSYLNGVELNFN